MAATAEVVAILRLCCGTLEMRLSPNEIITCCGINFFKTKGRPPQNTRCVEVLTFSHDVTDDAMRLCLQAWDWQLSVPWSNHMVVGFGPLEIAVEGQRLVLFCPVEWQYQHDL